MALINVKDAADLIVAIEAPNANGRVAAAASRPVVLSTEDKAVLDSLNTKLPAQGQAVMASSRPVVVASDQVAIPVRASLVSVVAEVTRPADTTAYAVNDVIGTAGTAVITLANIFRVNGASAYVVKAKLFTDQSANVAQFRMHLFRTAPAAIVDNAPFQLLYADESRYLGFIDIPGNATEGSGSTTSQGLWTGQLGCIADAASTTLFAVLATKTAFTPASAQRFSLRVTVDQN